MDKACIFHKSLCEKGVEALPYVLSCVAEDFRLGRMQQGIKNLNQVLLSSSDGLEERHSAKLFQYGIPFVLF